MAPLATSVTEPPDPPAPPLPAILSKIPLGSFIPPAPPVPPNEVVSSPNVARPVIGSAHESGGEIDRQIAASATGAAIAASDTLLLTKPLSPPAPPSPPRLTIGAHDANDRQAAVRAADLGARLPRTAGTAGVIDTIRPVATDEAK